MPDVTPHYLDLPVEDQAQLLNSMAPILGRRAAILEKDVWLCELLGMLFRLPVGKPMAFKGGTSLSKVYQAIHRFSEDIDVTIDYRHLAEDAGDLAAMSKTQRRKLSDRLKAALQTHVKDELVPALQATLTDRLPAHRLDIEVSDDAEKLWIYYPSAVEDTNTYVRPSILIEFGGRNATLPQEVVTIVADIAPHVPGLRFSQAQVNVLSAARTFWEKATLIHVECHRAELRLGAERLSRHWYDLARLADHAAGQDALADAALLRDVLDIKETFFSSAHSNYHLCNTGGLRLVPDEALLSALRQDYQAMLDAQMFYGERLSFEAIIERLRALERQINQGA